MEKYYTEKFDERLLDIGGDENPDDCIYPRFKQMLPWIGRDYDSGKYKKLLLIGESHYLPEDADERLLDPHNWYNEDHSDYYIEGNDEEQNTNTRTIINPGKWSSRAHHIYRGPHKVIADVIKGRTPERGDDNFFRHVAYYNFFLRPARQGQSFRKLNHTDQDWRISHDTFREFVGILKPDAVYFLSKYAWDKCNELVDDLAQFDFVADFSPHPCCAHWNMARYEYNGEKFTGKDKFAAFLKHNQIFD